MRKACFLFVWEEQQRYVICSRKRIKHTRHSVAWKRDRYPGYFRNCAESGRDRRTHAGAGKRLCDEFCGEYDQIPPMYSALKVNGKKLYELAREGKTIERKSRKVEIKEIRILEMALPRVRMEVSCSKGTYIRTLCHDIGEKLGCFGCMESLLRTKVSRFEIESSLKLSEIQKKREEGKLSEIITPLDAVFSNILP